MTDIKTLLRADLADALAVNSQLNEQIRQLKGEAAELNGQIRELNAALAAQISENERLRALLAEIERKIDGMLKRQ